MSINYETVPSPNYAAYANPGFGMALGQMLQGLPGQYMQGREMGRLRSYRIRLSPVPSCLRSWQVGAARRDVKEPKLFVQVFLRPSRSKMPSRTACRCAKTPTATQFSTPAAHYEERCPGPLENGFVYRVLSDYPDAVDRLFAAVYRQQAKLN
jgi:hypothetical protein